VSKKISQHTDAELLTLFKQTTQNQYLGELLERYSLLVFGVCIKYLKDHLFDAEFHADIQVGTSFSEILTFYQVNPGSK
jgi:hypothetical protein